MARRLTGVVGRGAGDAITWPTAAIRELVERPDLHEGTLNVVLPSAHDLTAHFTLPEELNNRPETLYFERCQLLIGTLTVPALIARTSTNFHGPCVLEIMADVHLRNTYGIDDGSQIVVQLEA